MFRLFRSRPKLRSRGWVTVNWASASQESDEEASPRNSSSEVLLRRKKSKLMLVPGVKVWSYPVASQREASVPCTS